MEAVPIEKAVVEGQDWLVDVLKEFACEAEFLVIDGGDVATTNVAERVKNDCSAARGLGKPCALVQGLSDRVI